MLHLTAVVVAAAARCVVRLAPAGTSRVPRRPVDRRLLRPAAALILHATDRSAHVTVRTAGAGSRVGSATGSAVALTVGRAAGTVKLRRLRSLAATAARVWVLRRLFSAHRVTTLRRRRLRTVVRLRLRRRRRWRTSALLLRLVWVTPSGVTRNSVVTFFDQKKKCN